MEPVDDLPPSTVILSLSKVGSKLEVRGTSSDNGTIKRVLVNGREARALTSNFRDWEAILDDPGSSEVKVTAHAEDSAGNVERNPHVVRFSPDEAGKTP
jgi:hypothetical protein